MATKRQAMIVFSGFVRTLYRMMNGKHHEAGHYEGGQANRRERIEHAGLVIQQPPADRG